jgi:hypothetical protein
MRMLAAAGPMVDPKKQPTPGGTIMSSQAAIDRLEMDTVEGVGFRQTDSTISMARVSFANRRADGVLSGMAAANAAGPQPQFVPD